MPHYPALGSLAYQALQAAGGSLAQPELAAQLGLTAPGSAELVGQILDRRFLCARGQVSLWEQERPWPPLGERIVVLDVEATGGRPLEDEIIEVGAVSLGADGAYQEFTALNDPGRPIPPIIVGLTGLKRSMLAGAPPLSETLPALHAFLNHSTLVMHDSGLDLAFLTPRFARLNLVLDCAIVDTLLLARTALGNRRRLGLSSLARLYDAPGGRHRAISDARATLHVAKQLYFTLAGGDGSTLASLSAFTPATPTKRHSRRRSPQEAS